MSHNVLNTVEQKSLSRRRRTFNQQLARHNRCSKVVEPPVKCYCGRPAGLGGADQAIKYWILPPDSTSSKLQQGWPVCGSGSWIGYAGVMLTRIAFLSRVWSCTWLSWRLVDCSLFFKKEMELSLIGLQNAGKTSLVNVLTTGAFHEDMIPTVGFNMRKVTKGAVTIKLWDLGGQVTLHATYAITHHIIIGNTRSTA